MSIYWAYTTHKYKLWNLKQPYTELNVTNVEVSKFSMYARLNEIWKVEVLTIQAGSLFHSLKPDTWTLNLLNI